MKTTSSKHTEPVRLLRRGGAWILEYTRLVSVDEHILRPERRRVAATSETLRSLEESYPRERFAEAVALMQEQDDGSERAFELAEDGWSEARGSTPSQRPLGRNELAAMLADTKAQLMVLRGLYDALLSRVVALEGTAARSQLSLPPRLGRRVPSRKSVLDALKNSPRGVPYEAPLAATATGDEPAARADDPPRRGVPVTPPANQTQASPGAAMLSTPGSADVVGCLEMLAAEVPVTAVKGPIPTDLADFYVSLLSDDAGEAIAALLFNRRAAAELGGGILGVAPADRDQQAEQGLTSDSLDGLNEIANNLTGLLNRSNPKHQVRLGALERGAVGLPGWLGNPAKKLGFSLRETGSLFLLVRGVPAT